MIGARQLLRVKDDAALRKLARTQADRSGLDVVESAAPLAAFINHGRWIAMCSCGSGVAVDPDLSIAVCFAHFDTDDPKSGISAMTHTRIVFPANRAQIEAALHKRAMNRNRNWTPNEDVDALARDNDKHGVK